MSTAYAVPLSPTAFAMGKLYIEGVFLMQKQIKATISVRNLALMGVLVAFQFILTRFLGIPISPGKRISFAFLPVAFAGYTMGPIPAAMINGVADILGALLVPQGGSIHLGFTLTAVFSGLLYGLFLYHKNVKIIHLILAHIFVMVLCQWGLNNIWLSHMRGISFFASWASRFWVDLIKLPADMILIDAIFHFANSMPKNLLAN